MKVSIASRRLRLRSTDHTDQPLLDRLGSRKEVNRFIGRVSLADDRGILCTILKGEERVGQVAIVRSSALEGLDVEIVCALVAEAEDGGLAWEACELLMIWYFAEYRPRRIIACVPTASARALRLASRLGMFLLGPRPFGDQLVYSREAPM
jgi:RimJ/RimL family protein N-acetyltransferase